MPEVHVDVLMSDIKTVVAGGLGVDEDALEHGHASPTEEIEITHEQLERIVWSVYCVLQMHGLVP